MMNKRRAIQLKPGDKAPIFSEIDVFGEKISLSDYQSTFTLVVFLRYAGCPWCNLAVHRLALEESMLRESKCEVIAFVQSSKENIIKNIYKRHALKPEFPIIADPNMKIYARYHVGVSPTSMAKTIVDIPYWLHAVKHHGFKQRKIDGNFFLVPAMFLISEGEQRILSAGYGKSVYEHETFTDLYQQLIFGDREVVEAI